MSQTTRPGRHWSLQTCAVLAYMHSIPRSAFVSGQELNDKMGVRNVYNMLYRFHEDGLVEVMDEHPYVYYRLTPAGRERASEAAAALHAHPLARFLADLIHGAGQQGGRS